MRNEQGVKQATQAPAVKAWFEELSSSHRKQAESLFGKINSLPLDRESDRRQLFKHSVLAFESLRYKDNLDALDRISAENLPALAEVFRDYDDIEATLYYQIVNERVAVIRKLQDAIDKNVRERVIQEHLFDHLWLLDTSWERAEATEFMEKRVNAAFKAVTATLTPHERKGRLDIGYRTTSGKHVIIELKRASRVLSTEELQHQARKYRSAVQKVLVGMNRGLEPVEVVCVVGARPATGRTRRLGMRPNVAWSPTTYVSFSMTSLLRTLIKAISAFLTNTKRWVPF